MAQSHVIVNHDRKQFLDPTSLGASPSALFSPVAMAALLVQLNGPWSGSSVAIVGELDYPTTSKVWGKDGEGVYALAKNFFDEVSHGARTALVPYGFNFDISTFSKIKMRSNGNREETVERKVDWSYGTPDLRPGRVKDHDSLFVVYNMDKNQFIDPWVFGMEGGFDSTVLNVFKAENRFGSTTAHGVFPFALGQLLRNTANYNMINGSRERALDGLCGSWAGDRIMIHHLAKGENLSSNKRVVNISYPLLKALHGNMELTEEFDNGRILMPELIS